MKSAWLTLCAAGIASFLVATPAMAGWKNFGLGNSPSASSPVQGVASEVSGQQQDGLGIDDALNELVEDSPIDIPVDVPGPEDTGNFPQGASLDLPIPDIAPQVAAVPEPATMALIAQSLLCLAWLRRRKR